MKSKEDNKTEEDEIVRSFFFIFKILKIWPQPVLEVTRQSMRSLLIWKDSTLLWRQQSEQRLELRNGQTFTLTAKLYFWYIGY